MKNAPILTLAALFLTACGQQEQNAASSALSSSALETVLRPKSQSKVSIDGSYRDRTRKYDPLIVRVKKARLRCKMLMDIKEVKSG